MFEKLFYDCFKDNWMNALPVGNGRIGGMFYGNPDNEKIEINEESLWNGKTSETVFSPESYEFDKISQMIFDGKIEKATEFAIEKFFKCPERIHSYESFGELTVRQIFDEEYTTYEKYLDLSKAIAGAKYYRGRTLFNTQCFVSEKYDVFVYHCDAYGNCNSEISFSRESDAYVAAIDNDTLIIRGRLTRLPTESLSGGEGMSLYGLIKIKTDGKLTAGKKSITVKDGNYFTVYADFETDYNAALGDIDDGLNLEEIALKKVTAAAKVDFTEILSDHILQSREKFDRVKLKIDCDTSLNFTTDKALKRVKEGYDPKALTVLYYNFGRYLLYSCSGKNAELPANLQGIWCHGNNPPWCSDFHTNINLQMNYWPCENANMSETFAPFLNFMKNVSQKGKTIAKNLYSSDGWAINHTTTPFYELGVHDFPTTGIFPTAGAWLCANLWEHFEFGGDTEYLKTIYPILKGACEFLLGLLKKSPE